MQPVNEPALQDKSADIEIMEVDEIKVQSQSQPKFPIKESVKRQAPVPKQVKTKVIKKTSPPKSPMVKQPIKETKVKNIPALQVAPAIIPEHKSLENAQ